MFVMKNRKISKSLLYINSLDILYFFQSCKVSQFFLIQFICDVLLQFLCFSKFADFVYFKDSSDFLSKYLLKRYVLSILFSFYSFSYSECYSFNFDETPITVQRVVIISKFTLEKMNNNNQLVFLG